MTDGDGLVLEGVSAGYGETIVLERIDFELPPGGTLAVLGRNGVGKTTLIATIIGRTRLRAGSIRFAGREVAAMRPFRRARLGIGLVPQEREIFPSLTVAENLLVAARPGRWSLDQVFDFFPALAERRRHRGNQLSGGEQQMLAIGRALIGNPSLLLLDEPLEGLAPVIVDALLGPARPAESGGRSRVAAGRAARPAGARIDRPGDRPRPRRHRLLRPEPRALGRTRPPRRAPQPRRASRRDLTRIGPQIR